MNILILTPIYTSSGTNINSTKVVHYFAKEWVNMGHKVYVVYNKSEFPKLFYLISKFFVGWLEKKSGAAITNKRLLTADYEIDGVKVSRFVMKKTVPHSFCSQKTINRLYEKTKAKLYEKSFAPDVVFGHWEEPQLPLVCLLKKYYKTKGVLVFHGLQYIMKSEKYIELLKEIDVIGFRSVSMQKEFEAKFWVPNNSFICYSGIPIVENSIQERTFNQKIHTILYVGMLIERKYPDVLLDTIIMHNKTNNEKIELTFVGDGAMKNTLLKKIHKTNNEKYITVHSRMARDKVFKLMKLADCFVMISKNEVFGLVYLEAMLQGCIVVASRNEGMDGIIIDGINGFLCEAGNKDELYQIIDKINSLSIDKKREISDKAIDTAYQYSELAAAISYLSHIERNTLNK
ncbi:N-acetyl-alpha-D-glucosaminyl L-malate synthase [termite gut metagenome]|uniref:N-acetyl-alpha-D-glucosaminyl L-malate synthase n=1 Tax=termite gut metagenome TaxID=433724 RepID=A0A5J4SMB2_9ZZZZ